MYCGLGAGRGDSTPYILFVGNLRDLSHHDLSLRQRFNFIDQRTESYMRHTINGFDDVSKDNPRRHHHTIIAKIMGLLILIEIQFQTESAMMIFTFKVHATTLE